MRDMCIDENGAMFDSYSYFDRDQISSPSPQQVMLSEIRTWWRSNFLDALESTSLSMIRNRRDEFLGQLAKIGCSVQRAEFNAFLIGLKNLAFAAAQESMENHFAYVSGGAGSKLCELVDGIFKL